MPGLEGTTKKRRDISKGVSFCLTRYNDYGIIIMVKKMKFISCTIYLLTLCKIYNIKNRI